MIVNKKKNYQEEVGRLHRRISEIQYQLANVKVEARIQFMLEIFVRKESENRLTAFERIRRPKRRGRPYVAMLIEISVRKIANGFESAKRRLLLLAFVRVKMLSAEPRPLVQQNALSELPGRRRRDLASNRKEHSIVSCQAENVELKHKIKQIELKFKDFVCDLQKIAPEVIQKSLSLSPPRRR